MSALNHPRLRERIWGWLYNFRQFPRLGHWGLAGLISAVFIGSIVITMDGKAELRWGPRPFGAQRNPGIAEGSLNHETEFCSMSLAIWENVVIFDPSINNRDLFFIKHPHNLLDSNFCKQKHLGLWAENAAFSGSFGVSIWESKIFWNLIYKNYVNITYIFKRRSSAGINNINMNNEARDRDLRLIVWITEYERRNCHISQGNECSLDHSQCPFRCIGSPLGGVNRIAGLNQLPEGNASETKSSNPKESSSKE